MSFVPTGRWEPIVLIVASAAVVFQFVQIGNDPDLEESLWRLSGKPEFRNCVDTLSGSDLIELIYARAAEGGGYQVEDQQRVCAAGEG